MPEFNYFRAQESDPSGAFQQYARSGEYLARGIEQAGSAIAGAFERNLALRQQRSLDRERFDREVAMRQMLHAQQMQEAESQRDYLTGAREDEQAFRSGEAAQERDFRSDLEDRQSEQSDRREMMQNTRMLMQSRMAAEAQDRPYRERAEREQRATEARKAALHLFASKDSSPVFSAKVPPRAMGAVTRGMKPEDFDSYVGGMFDEENAKNYQKAATTPQDVSWIDEDSWAKHAEVFGNRWGQEGLDALEEARKAYGHEIGIEKAYEGAFGKFEKQLGGIPSKRSSGAGGETRTPVPVEGAPTVEAFGRMKPGQQEAVLRVVAAKMVRQGADMATQLAWDNDPGLKKQAEADALEEAKALYGYETPQAAPRSGGPQEMPPLRQSEGGGSMMPELPGGAPQQRPQAAPAGAPAQPAAPSGSPGSAGSAGGDTADLDTQIKAAVQENTPEGRERAKALFRQLYEREKAKKASGPPPGEGWKQTGEQKWERPSILGGTSTFERGVKPFGRPKQ